MPISIDIFRWNSPMFDFLRQRRRRQYLSRQPIKDSLWQNMLALPLLRGFSVAELAQLRDHAAWFLHTKTITPVHGLEINDELRLLIAVQAALPVMNLGFDAYEDWQEVVLYPGRFISRDLYTDSIGLVHQEMRVLSGQARHKGSVLLSMQDVIEAPYHPSSNVVIHEMAHKLDMRSGSANGCPPLHQGMSYARWKKVFSRAYLQLSRRAQMGEESTIDLYAAENPAECLAVCSETFFAAPHLLLESYPDVYQQLNLFYRQDPAARRPQYQYRPVFMMGGWA
jgi:Mlc titration factor MtfA (ptsG expression regulator)